MHNPGINAKTYLGGWACVVYSLNPECAGLMTAMACGLLAFGLIVRFMDGGQMRRAACLKFISFRQCNVTAGKVL